jgi:hypothetical protein
MFILAGYSINDYEKWFPDYYIGKLYMVNHEYYPAITNNIAEAKKYKSLYCAEKSRQKVEIKTGIMFEIKELEEK